MFGTSALIAGLFKQMRLLKPWKDTQRFYLVYGMVPTLLVTINQTQNSSEILERLDAKYKDDYKIFLVRKAEEQMLESLNSKERE